MEKNSEPSDLFQILRPNGELTSVGDPEIPTGDLLSAYKSMVMTRMMDDKINALQRQGRMGTYVPCAGQEATQVGAVFGLSKKDWVFPMYRDLGMMIQVGVPVDSIINRLFSNAQDATIGRDLPNAYAWRDYRIFSVAAPIASHVCPAVGFAMAAKMRKDDLVTLSSFGDGATSSSEFHVSMNFAGVYKAPTIFLCENNQYAISVPLTQQTASATIAVKARAYGFEGIRIDGNDLFAVYSTVRKAAESARRGEGPTLVECYTYRLGAHSTADDWKRYRSNEEVESWKGKDPILRVRAYLEDTRKVWSDEKETNLRAEIEGIINAAITKGESIPPPAIETMFEDVYAEPTTNLKEQKEDLLSSSPNN